MGITWGGLVGDRGHRKGQLCVLGSPSARRTKEPRTGGPPGGAGSPRTRFFLAKVPSYISEGTKTGLQTPRANRYHSSYLVVRRKSQVARPRTRTRANHTLSTTHNGPLGAEREMRYMHMQTQAIAIGGCSIVRGVTYHQSPSCKTEWREGMPIAG